VSPNRKLRPDTALVGAPSIQPYPARTLIESILWNPPRRNPTQRIRRHLLHREL